MAGNLKRGDRDQTLRGSAVATGTLSRPVVGLDRIRRIYLARQDETEKLGILPDQHTAGSDMRDDARDTYGTTGNGY